MLSKQCSHELVFIAGLHRLDAANKKAVFYLMNTSRNCNRWGVTQKALDEALPSLLKKPLGMGKVHAFHKLLFCGWLVLITQCQFCLVLMERKTWSLHFVLDPSEEPVQNPENFGKKQPKKRSQADKIGKLKYLLQKDQKLGKDIAEIRVMLRTLREVMESSLHYDQPKIEKLACEDELDRETLQMLYEAGSPGLLPKDVAIKLEKINITRHQVRRRLLRMNKPLQKRLIDRLLSSEAGIGL